MLEKAKLLLIKVDNFLSKGANSIVLLICISLFFCFWRLGGDPLHEWDESRNGVNAIEMLQNSDYINLDYAGQPDTWNAKPPLVIWLIAASYKLFGFNEFALRFPAALATFLSILVLYHLMILYTKRSLVFFTCIILLTADGLIGDHVGRTGDFDAPLLLFLLLSIFHFVKYLDFNKKYSLMYAAIFLGLAFYTKGLASLIIVPGLFLYTLISRKVMIILKDKMLWFSAIVFLAFVASWFTLVHFYGLKFVSSYYDTSNSFQTMWKYDILHRLTSGFYDKNAQQDYAFFFSYLDVKFNLWNYVFYLSLLFLLIAYLKHGKYKSSNEPLVLKIRLLSSCIFLSLGLLLSLSAEAHFWYMTPALPFIAIFMATGVVQLQENFKFFSLVITILLVFTLGRKIVELNNTGKYPQFLTLSTLTIKEADTIILYGMNRQDYLLYLKFNNKNVQLSKDVNNHNHNDDELLMVSRDIYNQSSLLKRSTKLVSGDENYCFLQPTGTHVHY
jgi:4-amino-4-deoxy-L-arabinose transferase-like glycosyltransferase